MNGEPSADQYPGQRLLGGWRDLIDEIRRLERRIASVDGTCRCGHAAGENAACPCCESAARDLAAVCDTCSTEIAAIAERLRRIEDDTLRFLPVVFELFARTPDRQAEVIAIEHSLTQLQVTFRHLQSATDEWGPGCRATHLPLVKARAEDVAIACRRFDDALRHVQ